MVVLVQRELENFLFELDYSNGGNYHTKKNVNITHLKFMTLTIPRSLLRVLVKVAPLLDLVLDWSSF